MSDQWIIYGTYQGNREEIDIANSKQERDYMVREYMFAFGKDWTITAKKKRG